MIRRRLPIGEGDGVGAELGLGLTPALGPTRALGLTPALGLCDCDGAGPTFEAGALGVLADGVWDEIDDWPSTLAYGLTAYAVASTTMTTISVETISGARRRTEVWLSGMGAQTKDGDR